LLAVDAASANLITAFGVERFYAATADVDVLLANADEAFALTGLREEAAALELGRHCRVACIKLGSEGAVAASAGVTARAVVRPVDGANTLGAGDTFAAALLLALAGGTGLATALEAGCDTATASIAGRATSRA
jgi:sugar/nucleoside kinase (ribokinase family)